MQDKSLLTTQQPLLPPFVLPVWRYPLERPNGQGKTCKISGYLSCFSGRGETQCLPHSQVPGRIFDGSLVHLSSKKDWERLEVWENVSLSSHAEQTGWEEVGDTVRGSVIKPGVREIKHIVRLDASRISVQFGGKPVGTSYICFVVAVFVFSFFPPCRMSLTGDAHHFSFCWYCRKWGDRCSQNLLFVEESYCWSGI